MITFDQFILVDNKTIVDSLYKSEADIVQLTTDYNDLLTIYGSTVSAAASASAAEIAKDAAETARNQAQSAETAASDAQTVAENAATAASESETAAGNSATAASGSASIASTKADEASASASQANASFLLAQTEAGNSATSAGEASVSASEAASSESNAQDSASAAAISQGLAADSASDAAGYASAANTSAQTASTKAGEANLSASAANTSKLAAETALYNISQSNPNLLSNGGFEKGSDGWTLGVGAYVATSEWGPQLVHPGEGTFSSDFTITEGIAVGTTYTLSADFSLFVTSGGTYVDVLWYNDADVLILDDGGPGAINQEGFGNRRSATVTCPVGATKAKVRFVSQSVVGNTFAAIRRIKLEVGSVATPYSTEAAIQQIFSQATSIEERVVLVETNYATATEVDTLEAKVNRTHQNLVPNGYLTDPTMEGWYVENMYHQNQWQGPRMVANQDGARVIISSPVFNVFAGQPFTAGVNSANYRTANETFVRMVSRVDAQSAWVYHPYTTIPAGDNRVVAPTVYVPAGHTEAFVEVASLDGAQTGYLDVRAITCVAGTIDVPNAVPSGDLNTTAATARNAQTRVAAVETNKVDVSTFNTLDATVNNPTTGLATKASTSELNSAVADESAAMGLAIDIVEAKVDRNLSSSGNLLHNPTFENTDTTQFAVGISYEGWTSYLSTDGFIQQYYPTNPYALDEPSGARTIAIGQSTGTDPGWHDLVTSPTYAVPAEEGDIFIASVYLGAHRTNGNVYVGFTDKDGAWISHGLNTTAVQIVAEEKLGGPNLSDFKRCYWRATAPSGTKGAIIYIRHEGTQSGANSYIFATKPMLERVSADQLTPSPYQDSYHPALSASVVETKKAVADINGQLVAHYALVVDGGGNGAFVRLSDGVATGSAIILSADEITLDGNVLITGTLTRDRLATGEGNALVAEGLTANYYEQANDPGAVANGSIWFKSDTNELYIRRSGSWGKIADISPNIVNFTASYNASPINNAGSGASFSTGTISINTTGLAGSKTYETTIIESSSLTPKVGLSGVTASSFTLVASGFSIGESETGVIRSIVADTTTGRTTIVQAGYSMTRTS